MKKSLQAVPAKVIHQLNASVSIQSLNDALLGMIVVAVNSHASKILATFDLSYGSCEVEYDGYGPEHRNVVESAVPEQLRYTADENSGSIRPGNFLVALSALSQLRITTSDTSTRTITEIQVNFSRILLDSTKKLDASTTTSYTRITVQNLFGNMPVRVKRQQKNRGCLRAKSICHKAWSEMVQCSVSLLAAIDERLSLRLIDQSTGRKMFLNTSSGRRSLSLSRLVKQAGLVEPGCSDSWRAIKFSSKEFALSGVISSDPVKSSNAQFMSIQSRPILKDENGGDLFDLVNHLFSLSKFGEERTYFTRTRTLDEPFTHHKQTAERARVAIKYIRWYPMFHFDIRQRLTGALGNTIPYGRAIDSGIPSLRAFIAAAVHHWLETYSFCPRGSIQTISAGSFPTYASYSEIDTISTLPSTVDNLSSYPSCVWSKVKEGDHNENIIHIACSNNCVVEFSTVDATLSTTDINKQEKTQGDRQHKAWRDPQSGHVYHIHSTSGAMRDLEGAHPSKNHAQLPTRRVAGWVNGERNSVLLSKKERAWPKPRDGKPPVTGIASQWQNPVFTPGLETSSYPNIDQLTESQRHALENGQYMYQHPYPCSELLKSYQMTSGDIAGARVIAQVDRKFIFLATRKPPSECKSNRGLCPRNSLLILDQHAADERINVEKLMQRFCEDPDVIALKNPIRFACTAEEGLRLLTRKCILNKWGILYEVTASCNNETSWNVSIEGLPELLEERSTGEPDMVIDLLREEALSDANYLQSLQIQSRSSWLRDVVQCPRQILEAINSHACRNAIMFNDPLTKTDCQKIIFNLSNCALPFQCAHGRPSIVPVSLLGSISNEDRLLKDYTRPGFTAEFRAWHSHSTPD